MIHRFYKKGTELDVAGLNRITVLLDRSETELTEVGWNCWRAGLDGPPHRHDDKDQVFYVTDGAGTVVLGKKRFSVSEGNAVYVPAGLVHQTIAEKGGTLCYLLLNVFANPEKEGHATFAEHIEKVKETRRQQAESGKAGPDAGALVSAPTKEPRFIDNVFQGRVFEFGSNNTILLLDRNQTNKFELVVVEWPPGNKGAMVAHKEKEQTFFILKGHGAVTVGETTEKVKPGDLVFVPRNTPHTTESFDETLSYLCLNSSPVPMQDASFEVMYKRISPGRIERWKAGDQSVGD